MCLAKKTTNAVSEATGTTFQCKSNLIDDSIATTAMEDKRSKSDLIDDSIATTIAKSRCAGLAYYSMYTCAMCVELRLVWSLLVPLLNTHLLL